MVFLSEKKGKNKSPNQVDILCKLSPKERERERDRGKSLTKYIYLEGPEHNQTLTETLTLLSNSKKIIDKNKIKKMVS